MKTITLTEEQAENLSTILFIRLYELKNMAESKDCKKIPVWQENVLNGMRDVDDLLRKIDVKIPHNVWF